MIKPPTDFSIHAALSASMRLGSVRVLIAAQALYLSRWKVRRESSLDGAVVCDEMTTTDVSRIFRMYHESTYNQPIKYPVSQSHTK